MGLFDFMLSPEKKIAKHTRRLTNRDAQPEDREASAQWLAGQGTPQAIMGLLARFDMKLDHDLKNQAEREQVFDLLRSLGDDAVEPTRAWLRQCKSVAQPLALLSAIQGEEAAIQAAFEVLRIEHERGNDFKPAKKKAVLIWLAERRHPGAIDEAARFVDDFDEGVRYAVAEVIAAQKDPAGREPLLRMLTNPEEESGRLRARICEVFVQQGWSVGESAAALDGHLPGGFTLRGERIAPA
jgi:HEAT repeat protein